MSIRQKIFLTILIITSVLSILIYLLVKPLLPRIQKLSQIVEQQQAIMKNPDFQKQYQAQIAQLQRDYQAVEPKLSLLKHSILEKERAVEFIKILENTAQQANLTQEIRVKSNQASKEEAQEDGLIFNLSLVGNFTDLLKFLEIIENNQYLLQTQKIQIKALRDKEKRLTGQIQSNVEIKVYINQ